MTEQSNPDEFLRRWQEAEQQYAEIGAGSGEAGGGPDLREEDAAHRFGQGWERLHDVVPRFNLAILGNAGTGKSSLVNAIFGDVRAKVGIGAPVTQRVEAHDNASGTLRIYDFPGFELDKKKRAPVKMIKSDLAKIQKGPADERIHLAWFAWDQNSRRVEDAHRAAITALVELGIPVIGVVTKVRDDEMEEIREFGGWIRENVSGLWSANGTKPTICFTRSMAPTAGLTRLLDETRSAADATFQDSIDAAQKLDATQKRRAARTLITSAAAAAAGVAFVPVPVATAAVLAPVQLTMMGQIARLYGLKLTGVVGGGGALVQLALQFTGRAAAQSLIKFIPGAGSVVNASVASVWTYAAGEAWLYLCEGISTGKIDPDEIGPVFSYLQPIIEMMLKAKFKAA